MKSRERFLWITLTCTFAFVILFTLFVNASTSSSVSNKSIQKFLTVLEKVKRDYVDDKALDDKKLINGAIKGMLDAIGDPHTVYLSPEELSDLRSTSEGAFGGVGMIISERDDYTVVVSPIEDTPAYKKGMKPGDLIITVDGKSTKGLRVDEVAKMLKGTPGTSVKIEFLRDEVKFEVELIRANIDFPSVKSGYIGDNNKYGYLRITQFAGTTSKHVHDELIKLMNNKIEGLIVDLRMNPGGLLRQVVEIVDYFQDDGVIVSTKGRSIFSDSIEKANKFNTIVPKNIPMIVLIDDGSASASEIFAGAVKDTNRAILVGDKSYGKGSVQTFHELDGGVDGFKLTIAKYYTPSGICIDGIGIEPDIKVKEPEFSEQEKETLKKLYTDKIIDQYVKKNPKANQDEVNKWVAELKTKGYNLPDKYLKKLFKNALDISVENKPPYDLEYDIQLQKALEILNKKEYQYNDGQYNIVKQDNTKTGTAN